MQSLYFRGLGQTNTPVSLVTTDKKTTVVFRIPETVEAPIAHITDQGLSPLVKATLALDRGRPTVTLTKVPLPQTVRRRTTRGQIATRSALLATSVPLLGFMALNRNVALWGRVAASVVGLATLSYGVYNIRRTIKE